MEMSPPHVSGERQTGNQMGDGNIVNRPLTLQKQQTQSLQVFTLGLRPFQKAEGAVCFLLKFVLNPLVIILLNGKAVYSNTQFECILSSILHYCTKRRPSKPQRLLPIPMWVGNSDT